MLESVRQYGPERLEERGETERVWERHARYYLSLGEAAEPELIEAGQVAWLERLGTEYGNLRAALSWCLDEKSAKKPEARAEISLRLAGALGGFWSAHGPREGRRWVERGLATSGASPPSVRAKALVEAGFIAVYQGGSTFDGAARRGSDSLQRAGRPIGTDDLDQLPGTHHRDFGKPRTGADAP